MSNYLEEPHPKEYGENPRANWLFVVGQGRSGSTLLGNLLTDAARGFNCGELQSLWEGMARDRLCTCGAKLTACELWASVVDLICAEMGFDSIEDGVAASRRRTRQRSLLSPWPPRPTAEEIALRSATEGAVERVTGATTLIDSSKIPPMMWTAAHLDRPFTVVHLVRDPRGVAYSWGKETPDPSQKSGYMARKNAWQSAVAWNAINLTTTLLIRRLPNVALVEMRYEDLAERPTQELQRVWDESTETYPPGFRHPMEGGKGDISHAIGGNPRRFRKEEIKLDTRWQTAMSSRARIACTVTTLPLLRRFGYPVRSATQPHHQEATG